MPDIEVTYRNVTRVFFKAIRYTVDSAIQNDWMYINDDEPGLLKDFDDWLEGLAPHEPVNRYRHNGYEDNGDAHLKRQVMGREVVVAVTGGKLDFGPWEQIFYGEFDGRRPKKVLVKIIGE